MSKLAITAEPGIPLISMTYIFQAPRELVFKAFTDPKHLPRWWGPRYLSTTVDRMEVRPGGLWRYVQRDPQGNEFAFHGVYHDSQAPERLVYTFEFEGMPGHVLLETILLEDLGGRTKMTDSSVFQSVQDRDGMLQSGMESGAVDSMERMEELLATL